MNIKFRVSRMIVPRQTCHSSGMLIALPLLLTCATTALAQSSLQDCAAISAAELRLSCYDAAMQQNQPEAAAATTAGAQQPSAPDARKPVQPALKPLVQQEQARNSQQAAEPDKTQNVVSQAEPPSIREDDFGLELKKSDAPEKDQRTYTLAHARRTELTGWTLEFANGQVWKQVGTDPFTVSEGASYSIMRASFNSFFLGTSSNNRRMRISRQK